MEETKDEGAKARRFVVRSDAEKRIRAEAKRRVKLANQLQAVEDALAATIAESMREELLGLTSELFALVERAPLCPEG